ncbi:MAG TPA: GDSL-type esterase/lipase family protein [Pyrinomonadaceae bacterium]|jgi:lysophospholipase L1-like esterase|nr:GDSL-type esterase/lipase family protein [Pyrinomonadaceae bacterium]
MNRDRRNFLKYSALFSLTALLDPAKVFPFSEAGNELRMLVLGDSIMWGQGLADDRKFYYFIEKWLGQQTQRKVTNRVEAHSGATIAIPDNIEKYPRDRVQAYNQEINISTPTVDQQVRNSRRYYIEKGIDPGEVELILINGGLNDLSIGKLLNPLTKETWINSESRNAIARNMLKLLEDTCAAFPKARVMVVGYYPLVSLGTDPEDLCRLMRDVLGLTLFGKFIKWLLKLLWIRGKWENVCSTEKVQAKLRELVVELSCQSDAWCRESDLFTQAAVDSVNKTHPIQAANGAGPRAAFVKAPFAIENSYGASNTFLWRLLPGTGIDQLLKTDDQLFGVRREYCDCPTVKLAFIHNQACRVAGTGHPNLLGAKAYGDAIQAELERLMASAGWLGELKAASAFR